MTYAQRTLIAIGSYTPDDRPAAIGPAGLTTWWWDGDATVAAAGSADLASPSFVCWHPTLPVLYAVSELDEGLLTALALDDDGGLREIGRWQTGGAQPCWVTTDPVGQALLIANYGVAQDSPSSMTVMGLDRGGLVTGEPVVIPHRGSGPVADRQQHAHVHQVVPTADGNVLASDLGADRLTEYRIDPAATGSDGVTVTEVGNCAMRPGTGPRHIALAADGVTGFVTGELDGTVTVIRRTPDPAGGPGTWAAEDQVACTTRDDVPAANVMPSQVMLAGADRWLVVANRGTSTLAVMDLAAGLPIVHEQPIRQWPRYFTMDHDTVLVACQYDDVVEALQLDEQSGVLASLGVLATDQGQAALRAPSGVAVRR